MTTQSCYYVNTRLHFWAVLPCPWDLPEEWQQTECNGELMIQAQREGFRKVTSDDLTNGFNVGIFEGNTCLVTDESGRATIYPMMEAIHLLPITFEAIRGKIGLKLTVYFGSIKCWEVVIESISENPPHFAMLSQVKELFRQPA